MDGFADALRFEGGEGAYRLLIDDRWEAQPGNVFGGFLVAVAVRAAGLVASAGAPASVACQFLRPTRTGTPLDVEVTSITRGRTNELLAVTAVQETKTVMSAQVRGVDAGSGPTYAPRRRPAPADPTSFPLINDVLRNGGLQPPNNFNQIEARVSGPDGESDARAWWRLAPGLTYEDPYLEAARIAVTLDGAGAAVLRRLGPPRRDRRVPWGFSNLDALVHFHRVEGSDWLHTETCILTGSQGLVCAETQAWTVDREPLATALSQLRFFELRPDWGHLRETPV
jgi:acyl-coenzyme A thioesterase PaaI-like protein